MDKYQVAIHGCDDSTYFEMELTKEQLEFVNELCELSRKHSSYTCQPTMEVERVSK